MAQPSSIAPRRPSRDRRRRARAVGMMTSMVALVALSIAGGVAGASPLTTTVPSTPRLVRVLPGDHEITVTWAASSSATGYRVRTAPSSAGCRPTHARETSCTVPGLANGRAYKVTVLASSAAGSSHPSARIAATPGTTPKPPQAVQASAGNSSVTLRWDAPRFDGGAPITGYVIAQTTPTPSTPSNPCGPITGTARSGFSCVVGGLTNGTGYRFSVAAKNRFGTGQSSTSTTATPAAPPGAPRSVSAVPGDQDATVSWLAPSDDGGSPITSYSVISTPPSTPSSCGDVAPSATSCTMTGLTNGVTYRFTVTARTLAGSSVGAQSHAGVTPASVPLAPTITATKVGDQTVTISWTPPADGGKPVTSYSIAVQPAVSVDSCASVLASATSCQLTGLTDGTSYRFALRATNRVGVGPAATTSAMPLVHYTGQTSLNWSGYVETSATDYSQVAGSWTVPTLNCAATPNSSSSTWVGIGGNSDSAGNLLQTGTEDTCVAGSQQDAPWFELLPAAEDPFDFSVSPGDQMSAAVFENDHGVWETTLTDETTGMEGTFLAPTTCTTIRRSSVCTGTEEIALDGTTTETDSIPGTVSYAGGSSAEWIVEDPSESASGTLFPFADYQIVRFSQLEVDGAPVTPTSADAVAVATKASSGYLSVPQPAADSSFVCVYVGGAGGGSREATSGAERSDPLTSLPELRSS